MQTMFGGAHWVLRVERHFLTLKITWRTTFPPPQPKGDKANHSWYSGHCMRLVEIESHARFHHSREGGNPT
jgi:hypothetical protein